MVIAAAMSTRPISHLIYTTKKNISNCAIQLSRLEYLNDFITITFLDNITKIEPPPITDSKTRCLHAYAKMGSRGQEETQKLRENLESQLERLVQQLADLEEVKEELDPSEYNDTKEETLEQLKEFNERLSKMISGNMTLVDHLGLMQIATQAAISEAFSTPEIIRMFARREPKQLRQRLFEIERDFKLGQLQHVQYTKYKKELLTALKQLGEKLSDEEIKFFSEKNSIKCEALFEKVSENSSNVEAVLKHVTKEVQNLNKPVNMPN